MIRKLALPLCLLLLFSCGKDGDPMKREQEEMNKVLSGVSLDTYKAFKTALRGTAAAGRDTTFDRARMQLLSTIGYALVQNAADTVLNVENVIRAAQQAASIADNVRILSRTDEDSLPTILQNIFFVIDPKMPDAALKLSMLLNEDEEHGLLAASWIVMQQAPPGLCLYELSRVHDDSLRTPDLQVMAKLARTILYYQNNWPYHAEQAAGELIALTEKQKDYFIENPWPAYSTDSKITGEQAWHQLHALGFLLRGICREKMDGREDEALSDLETFVKEAESGGLENELTWSAGAYVALSKEDKDNALKYLDRLAASQKLSDGERQAIRETREYVAARNQDKALNVFTDKIAIVRIAGSYFADLLAGSRTMKELRTSRGGKEFLRLIEISPGSFLDPASLNNGGLSNQSKSLLHRLGI